MTAGDIGVVEERIFKAERLGEVAARGGGRSCPAGVLGIWPGCGRDADALLLSWRPRGLCGVLLNLAKLGYRGGQV